MTFRNTNIIKAISSVPTYKMSEDSESDFKFAQFEEKCMIAFRLIDEESANEQTFISYLINLKLEGEVREQFLSYWTKYQTLSDFFKHLKRLCLQCPYHVHDEEYYKRKMSITIQQTNEPIEKYVERFLRLFEEAMSAMKCEIFNEQRLKGFNADLKKLIIEDSERDMENTAMLYFQRSVDMEKIDDGISKICEGTTLQEMTEIAINLYKKT